MNESTADRLSDLAREWVACAKIAARERFPSQADHDVDSARAAFVSALNAAVAEDTEQVQA